MLKKLHFSIFGPHQNITKLNDITLSMGGKTIYRANEPVNFWECTLMKG